MMRRVSVLICLTFGLFLTGCGRRDVREPSPEAHAEPRREPNQYGSDDDVPLVWQEAGTLKLPLAVCSVAFSPDGKWLATGSSDYQYQGVGITNVWSVGDWREAAAIEHDGHFPSPVVFSPDGKWLITNGCPSNTPKVWSVGDWREAATLKHDSPVCSAAFSPDAKWLATGSEAYPNPAVRKIWSVGDWREAATLEHPVDVRWVGFSPDGKWQATLADWDTATVRSVGDWQQVGMLKHDSGVWVAAFSPDGKWLATGSREDTKPCITKVWSVGDWREVGAVKHGGGRDLSRLVVSFSPDGKWLATGSGDNTAKVWSVGHWQQAGTLKHSDEVRSVAFSPDGKWLATGSGDNIAKVWSVGDWQQAGALTDSNSTSCLAFSPDGRWLASAGSHGNAKVWPMSPSAITYAVAGLDSFCVRKVPIDWCAGRALKAAFPCPAVHIVSQAKLPAGDPAKARVTVTVDARGGAVYRLLGVVHAPDVPLWHERKLFFGHVEAGKSFERILQLPTEPSWPSNIHSFTLKFQEHNDIPPREVEGRVEVVARPRPRISVSFPERDAFGGEVRVRVQVDYSEGTWDLKQVGVALTVSGLEGGARNADKTIDSIVAGQTRQVDFRFENWKLDPNETPKLRVALTEARGVVPEPFELVLDKRPVLAVACAISDPPPCNQDNILQRGERAECVVTVENVGQVPTGMVRFEVTDFPSLTGLKRYGRIAPFLTPLEPRASHTVRFEVQPTHAFQEKEFSFKIVAEDDVYGVRTSRELRLEVGHAPMPTAVTEFPPKPMRVSGDGANAYSGASETSNYVSTIPAGSAVTVNAKTDEYYRVAMRDRGHVWVAKVRLTEPNGGGGSPEAPPWLAVAEPTAKVVSARELPVRLTAGAPLGLAKLQMFVGESSDPQVQQLLGGKRQEWAGEVLLPEAVTVTAVRFVVTDRKGQQEEQVRHVRYDPQVGDLYRKAYAVVIGTNYRDWPEKHQLDYAERDAAGVEQTLREHFLFTEVRSLYGRAATRNNMERLLFDWVPGEAEKDDAVFVYFAGHGITDKGVGYLVPHDGSRDLGRMSRNVGMDRLKQELAKRCQAKAMMVVADACFGGLLLEYIKVRDIRVVPRVRDELAPLRSQKARVVLTAGDEGETVQDAGDGQHSVFTGALLDALRAVETYTTGKRVFSRVHKTVLEKAQKQQTPQYGQWSWPNDPCTGDFVFIRK